MTDLQMIYDLEDYEEETSSFAEPAVSIKELIEAVENVMHGRTLSSDNVYTLLDNMQYYDKEAKAITFSTRKARNGTIFSHLLLFGIENQWYAVYHETFASDDGLRHAKRAPMQNARKITQEELKTFSQAS